MIPLAEVSSSWGSSLSEILQQNAGQYPSNIPGQSLVLGAQGVPAPWRLEGARDSRDGGVACQVQHPKKIKRSW